MTHYLYIMYREDEPMYKIGYSVDPNGRAKQINLKYGFNMIVLSTFPFDDEKTARRIEGYLHNFFKNKRVLMREYFDLEDYDIGYIEFAIKMFYSGQKHPKQFILEIIKKYAQLLRKYDGLMSRFIKISKNNCLAGGCYSSDLYSDFIDYLDFMAEP